MEAKLEFTTLKELGKKISNSHGEERLKFFTQLRTIHSEELEVGLQFYIQYLHGMYWRAQWQGTNDVMDLENANLHFDNIHLLALKHRTLFKDWKYYYYRAQTKLELIQHATIPEEIEGLKVVCNDIIKKGLSFNIENEKLISLHATTGGNND
jgi:hypothetical protein